MRKRVLDIAASACGLIIASPVMLIVAVSIKLGSPGPVIFTQQRVGVHGKTFQIHKFRTMRVDLGGPAISATGDPRVTRVGRFLRRSKLDELPQLYDVLRGSMSLVGPRPEVPYYVSAWPESARKIILAVRPGLTDPASITFRNEAAELAASPNPEAHYIECILPKKISAYVDYVENQSFSSDLKILFLTLKVVLLQ